MTRTCLRAGVGPVFLGLAQRPCLIYPLGNNDSCFTGSRYAPIQSLPVLHFGQGQPSVKLLDTHLA